MFEETNLVRLRRRIERGDFDPLLRAWIFRANVLDLLVRQGYDSSLLDSIPNSFSHPHLRDYLRERGCQSSQLPRREIRKLANGIRQQVTQVLKQVTYQQKPDWYQQYQQQNLQEEA